MRSGIGILVGTALLSAGLAACSNSSGSSTTTTKTAAATAAPAMKTTKVMASSNGLAVYTTNCSTCHQSDGKGAIGPPLAELRIRCRGRQPQDRQSSSEHAGPTLGPDVRQDGVP